MSDDEKAVAFFFFLVGVLVTSAGFYVAFSF